MSDINYIQKDLLGDIADYLDFQTLLSEKLDRFDDCKESLKFFKQINQAMWTKLRKTLCKEAYDHVIEKYGIDINRCFREGIRLIVTYKMCNELSGNNNGTDIGTCAVHLTTPFWTGVAFESYVNNNPSLRFFYGYGVQVGSSLEYDISSKTLQIVHTSNSPARYYTVTDMKVEKN